MKYRQFRLTHSLTQAKCAELLGVGERHWRTLEASNKPIALKHQVMLDYALKQRHLDIILAQLDREKNHEPS